MSHMLDDNSNDNYKNNEIILKLEDLLRLYKNSNGNLSEQIKNETRNVVKLLNSYISSNKISLQNKNQEDYMDIIYLLQN